MSEASWVPAGLVLWSLPVLAYLLVAGRRHGYAQARDRLGLRVGAGRWYGWSVLAAVAFGGVMAAILLAAGLREVMVHPNLGTAEYAGMELGIVALLFVAVRQGIYVDLGEELFFRGLLCGWLFPRLGVVAGNLVQAAVFVLPHLLVLLVDLRFWPLLVGVFAGGLVMGWLRHRSGSIGPAWVVHAGGDVVAAAVLLA